MLHPGIEARPSPIAGMGLFARVPLSLGELVWWKDPADVVERFTLEEIRSWAAEDQRRFFATCCQVGDELYSGPRDGVVTDIADYMNHSCDPNVWFAGDDAMAAMRNIAAGEEITYDNATCDSAEHFVMECRCRTPRCRGVVRGTDLRTNPELRRRFAGHAMRHVLRGSHPSGPRT